ncbi:MAG: ferrous iron transport protein B [Rikenellaceae bacterium]|nr:ferrous iron transport protein B [Rikenellaceae bacterium]
MKLSELKNGESAIIVRVSGHGSFRKRIIEMGFVRGRKVSSVLDSPFSDPVKYNVMGYDVSLRRSEAQMIEVLPESEAQMHFEEVSSMGCNAICDDCSVVDCFRKIRKATRQNQINVAIVGNPNSGKTSLFNALSGSSEHVGNYSGVTVDAKVGHFSYKGYKFNITDLPGTYSLAAYTPEEVYVRRHLFNEMPDVIINSVVASNIERNLYLTTELIDLNQRVVVALNMYDELKASGATLDYEHLGAMMGVPMVPTVARIGSGLEELLDTVIDMFEGRNKIARHIHIGYGAVMEENISSLAEMIRPSDQLPKQFPVRYWAVKLIEGDKEALSALSSCEGFEEWENAGRKAASNIEKEMGKDVETTVSDAKYGFIAGALEETMTEPTRDTSRSTRRIDRLVANKWLGFPLFLFIVWLMFYTTFTLGAYPQEWIERGFALLGEWVGDVLPDGPLRSLLVDGIIGGVGSVAVFLPNILILYLFISLMEDSGYMARAAFIMDKVMHRMGLHGKSFIPLIMGFGCNVPAIMATRTIESHSSRLITVLISPFMSCSARLPVYILLAGTFFPQYASLILVGLYLCGILVAGITARVLRAVKFGKDETPFVMELPPYRIPSFWATMRHMWDKCEQYMRKIGTVVLLATIVVWFLGYYPRVDESVLATTPNPVEMQQEQSFVGHIGRAIEPVMSPLGLDWRASVALLTSIPAKELVVSTLGVLYDTDTEGCLEGALRASDTFTPASALAFMVFILLFFPCIATVATIRSETRSNGWAAFTVLYNTAVAWLLAWLTYVVASGVL